LTECHELFILPDIVDLWTGKNPFSQGREPCGENSAFSSHCF
jgi:hypothetical protein